MRIVLLSTDLMLMSAAQGVADRHGASVQTAANADAALAACAEPEVKLLAIDLKMRPLDISALVAALRAERPTPLHILAGGPHVQEASLAAARDAGCDEVVTRGQFEARLDAAVARLSQ
jgi:DNA-binding response OmpR family regulator